MRKTFRIGEYVAHTGHGTIGRVVSFNSNWEYGVRWDGITMPLGPEKVPGDKLVSLDVPERGHFDHVLALVEIARRQLDVIAVQAQAAINSGWFTEDMAPIFRALHGLDKVEDRITAQVYQAEAEGRN